MESTAQVRFGLMNEYYVNFPSVSGGGHTLQNCVWYPVFCSVLWYDILADMTFSIDINECDLETDTCHVNATCTDTIGSYECTCNSGFEGNGVNCASKDKFQRNHHTVKLTFIHSVANENQRSMVEATVGSM